MVDDSKELLQREVAQIKSLIEIYKNYENYNEIEAKMKWLLAYPDLWRVIVFSNYNIEIIKFLKKFIADWENFLKSCPPPVPKGIMHVLKINP